MDPPYFADRQALLKGVGQTVLLNQIRDHVADENGWVTFRWTASPNATPTADASVRGAGPGDLGSWAPHGLCEANS